MENKKIRNWKQTVLILLIVSVALLPAAALAAENEALTRMAEVQQLLERYHVSGTSGEELADEAIRAMVEALNDPHTQYFSAEDFTTFTDSINQNYVGIGARLTQNDSGFVIIEVFHDSPARNAGLMPGDVVVAVDGEETGAWDLDQLTTQIRGPAGTDVKVEIERNGQRKSFTVTRDSVQIPSVFSLWFEEEEIAYIQFTTFSEGAESRFAETLQQMKANGMRGLIVDLRGNSGGYLHVAEEMAKHFLPEGTLVYTQDRERTFTPLTFSGGQSLDIPLVLLVDGGSASAAEVLTGALQDYEKATVVGTRTYGKGSVQQVYPLSGGAYLKLTSEQYYTPNQHQVDGVGIEPDIEVYGAVAQLLTAMRQLDVNRFTVDGQDGHWTLNGVEVPFALPLWFESEEVYVSARFIAALTGSHIAWNGEQKAIVLEQADRQAVFHTSDDGVRLENGVTYIHLDTMQETFAQVTATYAGGHLTIRTE